MLLYFSALYLGIILFKFVFFQWDKSCPKGLTDEKSLSIIIKKIGKLCCPKCGKELKHMHYYRKHVQWCGREVDMPDHSISLYSNISFNL